MYNEIKKYSQLKSNNLVSVSKDGKVFVIDFLKFNPDDGLKIPDKKEKINLEDIKVYKNAIQKKYDEALELKNGIAALEADVLFVENGGVATGATDKKYIASLRINLGTALAKQALLSISAINDELGLSASDSNAAIGSLSTLEDLLNKGALKTVRDQLNAIKPGFPIYKSVFDAVISQINNFESEYGL